MTKVLNCTIRPPTHTYDIEIKNGLLNDPLKLVALLKHRSSSFAIITDDTVAQLYGQQIVNTLSSNGLFAYLFTFPCGEQYKTRETKELLENKMLEKKLGRDTCIIAIGGGVVTDIGGFLAATYCRGIPFIAIPTTLLGMVDASIGGKNGVNAPFGKNLIGSIHQPNKVIIDPSALQTLPKSQLKEGIVEMIKHGLVADENFFDYLEKNVEALITLDSPILIHAIYESCRIKKDIIEKDEKDKGRRNILNFGHTIGHTLEHLSRYSLSHGEAVAIGLLVESYLSTQLCHLDLKSFERIKRILTSYQLPLTIPSQFSDEELLHTMAIDKKALHGQPRVVLINAIGSIYSGSSGFVTPIDTSLLRRTIQWMNNALYHY